jgi:hypothetical protein
MMMTIHFQTVESIGEDQFSAMCSDSTGNMCLGRKKAQDEFHRILDLGDCCHHMQNTIKDINKLSEFKEVQEEPFLIVSCSHELITVYG